MNTPVFHPTQHYPLNHNVVAIIVELGPAEHYIAALDEVTAKTLCLRPLHSPHDWEPEADLLAPAIMVLGSYIIDNNVLN